MLTLYDVLFITEAIVAYIEKIVEYYNHIRHCPEIREEMRKFAEENLTWEPQLKKVLEEIKTSDEK